MKYIVLLLLVVCAANAAAKKKGLVVLDELQTQNTHSIFFKQLQDRGYELTFAEATDPELEITQYGEHLYEFLVLFAPETDGFGGRLDVDTVLNFIDDGNDCIIVGGPATSDDVREIAEECGVEFGYDDSYVIDHSNFDISDFDGDHTLIIANDFVDAPIITGDNPSTVLYRGVDLLLESDNELLIPVLKGSSTSYGYSPDEKIDEPHVAGKNTVLLAALQARNNARVLVSGSLEFFSDDFFGRNINGGDAAGNQELTENIVGWVFHERGLLQASNIKHSLESGEVPAVYTVNQTLVYSIDVSEWNGKTWVPYDGEDVQVEFVMLDPYVRVFLDNNKGTLSKAINIPDVYGIYTLRMRYKRLGYTSISEDTVVTVRPYRHNEFERFIVAAYPYYASAFSMMAGLFIFSFVFLYSKEKKK